MSDKFPYEPRREYHEGSARILARPLLYVLQRIVFPRVTFRGDPTIGDILDEQVDLQKAIWTLFARSLVETESRKLWPAGTMYSDGLTGYVRGLIEDMQLERRDLGNGQIALLVHMPTPIQSAEAWQVAVVGGFERRYFLEEMGSDDRIAFLCEWTASGEHGNYGEFKKMTAEEFLHQVYIRVHTADA